MRPLIDSTPPFVRVVYTRDVRIFALSRLIHEPYNGFPAIIRGESCWDGLFTK